MVLLSIVFCRRKKLRILIPHFFCGAQLQGSTYATCRSKRSKGRTLGRLDWAFLNLNRLEKSLGEKNHYPWFTSIEQSKFRTHTLNSPISCFTVSLISISSGRFCRAKMSTWLSWIYRYVQHFVLVLHFIYGEMLNVLLVGVPFLVINIRV